MCSELTLPSTRYDSRCHGHARLWKFRASAVENGDGRAEACGRGCWADRRVNLTDRCIGRRYHGGP